MAISNAPRREACVRGTNLPALLSSLIGGERDAVAVLVLLDRPSARLPTLSGAPDIGKMRLTALAQVGEAGELAGWSFTCHP
jgi:hypothetical protein